MTQHKACTAVSNSAIDKYYQCWKLQKEQQFMLSSFPSQTGDLSITTQSFFPLCTPNLGSSFLACVFSYSLKTWLCLLSLGSQPQIFRAFSLLTPCSFTSASRSERVTANTHNGSHWLIAV